MYVYVFNHIAVLCCQVVYLTTQSIDIYIVDKEKHCQGPVQIHVLTCNYFPLCLGLRQIRLDQIDLPSEHV